MSCAEQEKLRVAIFSPDSAKTGQSAATQATLSSQEIVQTQVNPLPLVSTASNESRAKTEAFDVDPLTPRSAKSFEQSLKLQHELAKGVRAGAAAAVAKVKLLKATLMIQRVSRGSGSCVEIYTACHVMSLTVANNGAGVLGAQG